MQSILQFLEEFLRKVQKPRTKQGQKWRGLAGYAAAFLLIVGALFVGSQRDADAVNMNAFFSNDDRLTYNASHANVVETAVVAELASTANLPVRSNAVLTATSLLILRDAVLTTATAERPIISPGGTADNLGRFYRVLPGDTVEIVAAANGISAQTLRWANRIHANTNALTEGADIFIPAMDGVIYTVQASDVIERIAERYQGTPEQIAAQNDLPRVGGVVQLHAGERILIPNGILPANERPEFVTPRPPTTVTPRPPQILPPGVSNPYAWGFCTWYAFARRVEMGLPVGRHWGNAATWTIRARADGFNVSRYPAVGAIMQNVGGINGGLGHVAIVESIDRENNTLTISEMNARRGGGGWGRVNFFTFPLDQVSGGTQYWYIH
ncbi:CHAP domain-containing protein [Candidatus Saccharibacteria bacterium]|nr:CHAP domain-containing protein [Candidatus Saccharibacteria bacterium]